jgi:uncharacterized membrane protein
MAPKRSWYHPAGIARSVMLRPRLYLGALAGAAVFVAAGGAPRTVQLCLAWGAGATVYLVFAFRLMAACGRDQIRSRASASDDSRAAILILIMLSIGVSFVAIAQLIGHAKQLDAGFEKALLTGLAVGTIMLSWGVMQVTFALHYAHEYYLPEESGEVAGGLEFAGKREPEYWDFLYFSTSIGATSQTSDTAVASSPMRRLVTIHAVLAFFFNTAILALTINVAASLIG